MQEAGSLACPPQLDGLPHTWETMAAPGPVCRCHHAVGRAWGQGARPCSLLTHSTWHRAWMEQETRALLNEAEGHESPAPDSQFALGPGLRSLCSFFGPGPLERGEAQGTEVQPKPSRMSGQPTSHLRPLAHSPGLSSCRGWHRSRQVWHSGVPGLHNPKCGVPHPTLSQSLSGSPLFHVEPSHPFPRGRETLLLTTGDSGLTVNALELGCTTSGQLGPAEAGAGTGPGHKAGWAIVLHHPGSARPSAGSNERSLLTPVAATSDPISTAQDGVSRGWQCCW